MAQICRCCGTSCKLTLMVSQPFSHAQPIYTGHLSPITGPPRLAGRSYGYLPLTPLIRRSVRAFLRVLPPCTEPRSCDVPHSFHRSAQPPPWLWLAVHLDVFRQVIPQSYRLTLMHGWMVRIALLPWRGWRLSQTRRPISNGPKRCVLPIEPRYAHVQP